MSEIKMDDATRALIDILPHIEANRQVLGLVSVSGLAIEDAMRITGFYQRMSTTIRDHLSRVLPETVQLTTKTIPMTTDPDYKASFAAQERFIKDFGIANSNISSESLTFAVNSCIDRSNTYFMSSPVRAFQSTHSNIQPSSRTAGGDQRRTWRSDGERYWISFDKTEKTREASNA
ncbi:hypothetical protein TREMEDRAFT_63958 [Tremella mesenterica DSM 1558]|uniref:uncharacterized protein n=1 Tax=Tremella mesenterica (strain ATCC 24925 / CBS 8224 / DSM 1558 / NBRC 9311 / NRRL Y-6157 / RJB 2259-6 / UBC 559-6) TaxID=578456 RepID=UPI0003F49956|nr:uncharacterized protein TREMEDRAFT_63958 [Tremella mesenterica DSM 1558]EIW68070.1 hypothetical protein TREMEDRAFT_63958 [Tremella mesenterica DSM 1558]